MYKTHHIDIETNEFINENNKDLTIGENNDNILTIFSKLNIPGGNTGQVLAKQTDGSTYFNTFNTLKEYNNLTNMQSDINNVSNGSICFVNNNNTLYIKINNSWHTFTTIINETPTWLVPAFNTTNLNASGNSGDTFTLNASGNEMVITLNATDPEGASITYTISSIDFGGSSSNMLQQIYNNNSDRFEIINNIIKVTPSTSVAGTVTFNLQVTDGVNILTGNFILSVSFQPPTWSSPAFNVTNPTTTGNSGDTFNPNQIGTEMQITLNATDPDTPASNLIYAVTSISPVDPGLLQPVYTDGDKYDITDNIIKVTPSTTVAGNVQFNVSVSDGSNVITANFTLSLSFAPPTWSSPVFNVTQPTATGNSGSTFTQNNSGTEMEITLNASDPDTSILTYAVTSISPSSPGSLQQIYSGNYYSITNNVIKVTPSTSVAGTVTFNVSAFDGVNTITANFILSLSFNLYNFTSHTFTTAGVFGYAGPNLTQCRSAYSSASWELDQNLFNMSTNGIQQWKVPATATYHITVKGASGGYGGGTWGASGPGDGAYVKVSLNLTINTWLNIVCGQTGQTGGSNQNGSGGGGGTWVYTGSPGSTGLIVVAGGGGGWGHGWGNNSNWNKRGIGLGGSSIPQALGVSSGSAVLRHETGQTVYTNGTTTGAAIGYGGNGIASGGYGGGGGGAGWRSAGGNGGGGGSNHGHGGDRWLGGAGKGGSLTSYPQTVGGFGGGGGGGGNGIGAGGGGGYTGGGAAKTWASVNAGGNTYNSWGSGGGGGSAWKGASGVVASDFSSTPNTTLITSTQGVSGMNQNSRNSGYCIIQKI